ncbi:MAG: Rpn family recombination-promoting nuclease/putative transposase [Coprobacillus sp.]
MQVKIDYNSDVFFKYVFGRNTYASIKVRRFLLEQLLPIQLDNIIVDNPELIPRYIRDKDVILDIYMNRNSDEINIEMQKSLLSKYIYKRFQYYAAKMIANQLQVGDGFVKIKDIYQVILIEDYDRSNPKLIETFHAKQHIGEKELPFYIHTSVYVYLPYIEKIAESKDKLTEAEAMFYLIHKGTLEGIEYEEKEGVIKMIELLHRDFMKNKSLMEATRARYQKKEDYQAWHDMDVEEAKEQGMEQGMEEGVKKGMNYAKQDTLRRMIELKYGITECEWVSDCKIETIDKLEMLIINNASYDELKAMKRQ